MSRKVVIVADPGIDTAFALALALNEPALQVHGMIATAGNVGPEQATQNVHIVLEQLDPARWPRLGAALSVTYPTDGTSLHGPGGLGGVAFPATKRHEPVSGDKLLIDLIRESPREVTIVNLGPLTVLAQALDRDSELAANIGQIICLGGAWREPGNAGPVTEFHFACDPSAARRVLRCGAPLTLVPLDIMRKIVLSPSDLLDLPEPEARTCQFLRKIVPFGIRATANKYGIEGFHLKDVLGIVALTRPKALTLKPFHVDVETHGELTRGMLVVDARDPPDSKPNVEMATAVDVAAVRMYIKDILGSSV